MKAWLIGAALVAALGLLAALLVLALGLVTHGITVRVSGPIPLSQPVEMEGTIAVRGPIEVGTLTLSFPQPVAVEVPSGTLAVRASLDSLACPHCGVGTLLPVKWSLLTGEISWRCSRCGKPSP